MADKSSRQYDIVLFGATGYTGKLTAEHVARHLPTDLKWAVAGRNHQKLSSVVERLKSINPDRPLPAIETAELKKADLVALAKKTRLLITTVGPYHLYGEHALAACAENGTHYVDCTGEAPWVHQMINRYHKTALSTGSIIIPQCGIDSVPSDLIAFLLVKTVRDTLNVGTREVIVSQQKFNMMPSGGTLNTLLTMRDSYSLSELKTAVTPFALSPVPHPNPHGPPRPLSEKILGVRHISDLGFQTDALMATMDRAIVGRSWGLFDQGKYYGPNFSFVESLRARNMFQGVLTHFAIMFGFLGLMLGPVRWLLKKLVYQPGEGPEMHTTGENQLIYRAAAYPDVPEADGVKRAIADFEWTGSGYYLTGLFLAEAAMTILREKNTEAHRIGGGVLTPATLGVEYAERFKDAGVKLSLRMER